MDEALRNVETAVAEYLETWNISTAEQARDCFADALDRMYETLGFSYRRWKVGKAKATIRSEEVLAGLEKDLEKLTLTDEARQTSLLGATVDRAMTQLPGENYIFAEPYRGNNEFKRNLSRLKASGRRFTLTATRVAEKMQYAKIMTALADAATCLGEAAEKIADAYTAKQEAKQTT